MGNIAVHSTGREICVVAVAVATIAALAGIADVTRSPDSTAMSSAGAVNTTVGHSAVSDDGSLDTMPLGMVFTIR
ncbi:MAG: hypothetical protein IKF72_06100 [Kiritimatiellae bacterium]|nr:hypothetical protein [Kiritimatiellia bacterium]